MSIQNKVFEALQKMPLRRNEITEAIEIQEEKNQWNPIPIHDLWRKIFAQFEIGFKEFEEITKIRDLAPIVNPFKDWLKSLEEEKDDKIFHDFGKLIILTRENYKNRTILDKHLKNWFVAAVKSIFDPEYVPKYCLVLVGKEGIGKTPFLRSFLPKNLGVELETNPSVDHPHNLSHNVLAFVEEVSEWISSNNNNYRSFFAHPGTETKPRIASFLATARDGGFIEKGSISGSEFICIQANKIFNEKELIEHRAKLITPGKEKVVAETFPIEKLWSRAFQLYKEGFFPSYEEEELVQIIQQNELSEKQDKRSRVIFQYLQPAKKTDKNAKFMSSHDVAVYLNQKQDEYKFYAQTLGPYFKRLGYSRKASDRKIGYYFAPVEEEII